MINLIEQLDNILLIVKNISLSVEKEEKPQIIVFNGGNLDASVYTW